MNHGRVGVEVMFAEMFPLCEGEEAEDKMRIIFNGEGDLGKLRGSDTGRVKRGEVAPS